MDLTFNVAIFSLISFFGSGIVLIFCRQRDEKTTMELHVSIIFSIKARAGINTWNIRNYSPLILMHNMSCMYSCMAHLELLA